MTRGVADVFKIVVFSARAHAALRRGRPCVITFVLTEEHIFKLVHPGVSKQQRWIVIRYEGAAGYNLMSLAMKKVEKRLTDLSSALAHICPGITLTNVPTNRCDPIFLVPDQRNKKWE